TLPRRLHLPDMHSHYSLSTPIYFSFFSTHPPTPAIYPLSLHDALPISGTVSVARSSTPSYGSSSSTWGCGFRRASMPSQMKTEASRGRANARTGSIPLLLSQIAAQREPAARLRDSENRLGRCDSGVVNPARAGATRVRNRPQAGQRPREWIAAPPG